MQIVICLGAFGYDETEVRVVQGQQLVCADIEDRDTIVR